MGDRSLILREDCYNVVTPAPTVSTTLLFPTASERGGMLAMLFWVVPALAVVGVLANVWGCTCLSAAGFCTRPGRSWPTEDFPGPPTASEGQDRAHALGWGLSATPNRFLLISAEIAKH